MLKFPQNEEYRKFVSRQQILLTWVKYLALKGPNVFPHLRKQFDLLKVLKPFKAHKQITLSTYSIYLFSYVSKRLQTDEKLRILTFHYWFINKIFSPQKIKELFDEGIECYKENDGKDEYSVILKANLLHEFEGSGSLLFKLNDAKIFSLYFSFAPGDIFGTADKTVIFVSCMQGVKNEFENISKATKYFHDIAPPAILLKVLQAIASSLNITSIIGVSAKNQLSCNNPNNYNKFYQAYDVFWKNMGGVAVLNGNYHIPAPWTQKPITFIKQNHRTRAIKKRTRLNEVYINCYYNLLNVFTLPFLDMFTFSFSTSLLFV